MRNAWIWVILAVIVIAGILWWMNYAPTPTGEPGAASTALTGSPESQQNDTEGLNVNANVNANVDTTPMSASVTYNGTSYSPSTVTIKKGGTVTFTSTAGNMWVASASHPTHTGYDGTTRAAHCATGYTGPAPFDQCVAGTSYTFTFTKAGTWPYHDHINASAFGSVKVVE